MKKQLLHLGLCLLGWNALAQHTHDINSAANPAHKLPYGYVDYNPFRDMFISGHPLIYTKSINMATLELEDSGLERYVRDANGNYTEMYQSTTANGVIFSHNLAYTYTGSNPTSYRIESAYYGQVTAIRHATATFSGSQFMMVNYADSNFVPNMPALSTARDSFVYNMNNQLVAFYEMLDTSGTMEMKKRHRFEYSGSVVTNHYTDVWDTTSGSFVNSIRTKLVYDTNDHVDSTITYDWIGGSQWQPGEGQDFTFNSNGQLTEYTELDEDGSGGLEAKEKWEIAYEADQVSEQKVYDIDNGNWIISSRFEVIYCDDTLLNRINQYGYGNDGSELPFVFSQWLYGDTTINCEKVNGIHPLQQQTLLMNVYPNPVNNGIVQVQTHTGTSLRLLDMNGGVVASQVAEAGVTTIDVSGLPQGMYFLQAHGNTQQHTTSRKIIIQ